jgi:hypothetical protein
MINRVKVNLGGALWNCTALVRQGGGSVSSSAEAADANTPMRIIGVKVVSWYGGGQTCGSARRLRLAYSRSGFAEERKYSCNELLL